MAGRGYENGKYFEIDSRGKLKEGEEAEKAARKRKFQESIQKMKPAPAHPDAGKPIDMTGYMKSHPDAAKHIFDAASASMKEHEQSHWKQD